MVDHERDRRDAQPPHSLDQRQRHPAHGPPAHDIRLETAQLLAQHARVVPFDPDPLEPGQAWELVVAEVPAQFAAHEGVVGLGAVRAQVRGEDTYAMSVPLEVVHRGAPDELVAAEMVRRVHVPDGQNPHRAENVAGLEAHRARTNPD